MPAAELRRYLYWHVFVSLLIAVAVVALTGACVPPKGQPGPTPAAIASATVLDEATLAGAELSYKLYRTLQEDRVDSGKLTGQKAARAAASNLKAYAALRLARSAYAAGNAESFGDAVDQVLAAVAEGNTAMGGR